MKHMKLLLVLVLIGIACQNSSAALKNKEVQNTLNNMKIEDAELAWSSMSRKLNKDLFPKFERLADRLENIEQDILELKMALTFNKDKAK